MYNDEDNLERDGFDNSKPTVSMNIKNDCPIRKKCGACSLQNLEYDEQLSFKMSRVIDKLGKYGHIREIIEMEEPWHYRNKAQAMFESRSGHVITGIYKASTGGMASMEKCLLDDRIADKIIFSVRRIATSLKISVYNPKTGRGSLRHIMVRRAVGTGQILVAFATAGADLPKRRELVNELTRRFPDITTIVQCINDTDTPLWLGEREFTLFGPGYIEDTLGGKKFRVSAKSFYQINTIQTERLYEEAAKLAGIKKGDVVLDAYCGIGTIGISLADKAGRVIGVESNPAAIKDAKQNARLNELDNIEFVLSDAGKFMQWAAKEGQAIDVAVIDPPRAGCDKRFLTALLELKPKRLVYISCNVESQARDLQSLTRGGYKVQAIQPIDMFPHTKHIECLVSLTRS